MTCWPTRVLIQVWTTPNAEVIAATATMPITSQASKVTFLCGRAVSMTARSRNGDASPTRDEATMMAVTMASGQRWGRNSRPMRPRDTSRACAFSAAVTDVEPRVRPDLLISGFVCGDAKCCSILPGRARAGTRGLWKRL